MRMWEERIRLILAIVQKDLRAPLWAWLSTGIIATVGFLLLLPVALSVSYSRYSSPPQWMWYDDILRLFYAIYAGVTSLLLGISFANFHGGEIHRGTIRSVILYPLDMNDITIAKLASSLLLTAILSTILFLGFLGGFFLFGVFPAADFLAIHATALAMSFLALAVGVFLAQGLSQITGRMVISPSALGAIFLFLAMLFTETVLTFAGTHVALLSAQIRGGLPTPGDIAAVRAFAQAFSLLSPHHVGARLLGIAFGMTRMWADLHVVVPLAALAVVGGYALGKKLYLDIFIR